MENEAVMPDRFYEGFEKNIRSLVRAIHETGVFTIESCEGHLRSRKSHFPYVILGISPDTTGNLLMLIKRIAMWNEIRGSLLWVLVPGSWEQYPPYGYSLELRPQIGNRERSRKTLMRLQAAAREFAEFLEFLDE